MPSPESTPRWSLLRRRWAIAHRRYAGAALAALVTGLALTACYADRTVAPNFDCSGDECTCRPGFGDCDGALENGCETPLVDNPDHCGQCGRACLNGVCHVDQCGCLDGYADCDADPQTGCEAELKVSSEHCGSCGHDCFGGACSESRCEPTQFGSVAPLFPSRIAVGPPYLYAAARSEGVDDRGSVVAFPLDGGPAETMAEGEGAHCLTVSETDVFWRTTSQVWRASRSDHVPVLVADSLRPPPDEDSRCIAATSSHVYWFTHGTNESVERAPVWGGAVEQLQSGWVYTGMVADADGAYWSDSDQLWRAHAGSSTPESIASADGTNFGDLAIRGDFIYVTEQLAHRIRRVPRGGGESTVVVEQTGAPTSLAADPTHLYWINFAGRLQAVPLEGGETVELRPGLFWCFFLAVDDTSLYWLAMVSQLIMRLAK